MAQPVIVQVTGAVTLTPAAGSCGGSPSLFDAMQIYVNAAYGTWKSGRPNIASPTTPVAIPLEGISKVRFFAFKTSVPMKLLFSTPNGGIDQTVPCSDELIIHAPANGDEMTAIKVVGNGDYSYVIAGESS